MSIDDLLVYEKTIRREPESVYFEKLFLAAEVHGIHKKTMLYHVHKQYEEERNDHRKSDII